MNFILFFLPGLSFIIVYLIIPLLASYFARRGIVGIDVHKVDQRKIPEMCGLSIWIGVLIPISIATLVDPHNNIIYFSFFLTGLLAGLVGFVDDIKPMNPLVKPILTAIAAIPILLFHTYEPYPYLPFIGISRLTLIYPILILIGVAVTSNAVNMIDVFNGVMPGTSILPFIVAFLVLILQGKLSESYLALCMIMALSAFYFYNRYPAKIFAGDSGSLFVGACLGSLAIIGGIEVVMIVAILPQIMNAFYGLTSIGRLYEHREIKARPIEIKADGYLDISDNKAAPITLTRIILAEGPLKEKQIVHIMILLSCFASFLAIVTYFLIPW